MLCSSKDHVPRQCRSRACCRAAHCSSKCDACCGAGPGKHVCSDDSRVVLSSIPRSCSSPAQGVATLCERMSIKKPTEAEQKPCSACRKHKLGQLAKYQVTRAGRGAIHAKQSLHQCSVGGEGNAAGGAVRGVLFPRRRDMAHKTRESNQSSS